MASIKKRPDGRHRARYRDAAGREHSKHFARKVDAQRWLDETTAAIVTGRYIDPKAGRFTVETFAKQRRANLVHRHGYLHIIDNALNLHIMPKLGARPLSSLRRSDVQGFVSALAENRSANSVNSVFRVLSQIMGAAVDDMLIPASPCARVNCHHDRQSKSSRRPRRRSLRSPTASTLGSGRWWFCLPVQGCASRRRWGCRPATLTSYAGRCG